jgi:hypothetical protein
VAGDQWRVPVGSAGDGQAAGEGDAPEGPAPHPDGRLPGPAARLAIDPYAGAAELECLAAALAVPGRLGEYALTGRVARTSNALVYTATGGVFGEREGVLKLTGSVFGPLLARELRLLLRCQASDIEHIVRPCHPEVLRFDGPGPTGERGGCGRRGEPGQLEAVAMALPFLSGGDLVELIRAQAARTRHLGAGLAGRVGWHLVATQRALLCSTGRSCTATSSCKTCCSRIPTRRWRR